MHPNTTHNKHQAPLDPQQLAEQGGSGAVSQSGGNSSQQKPFFEPPTINLPKGGGAIQGIGEKFQANPVTGTGSMSVPIAMSPGRGGFTPQLALSYDSGAGNSPFGLGWNIGLPSISRKTSKGLPEYDGLPNYHDGEDADVFLLSGAEDLVPLYDDNERYERKDGAYTIHRYRPRIEGLFARIERWTKADGAVHWRSISKENITTIYGETPSARIFNPNPEHPDKIFQWLIERIYDDRGNVIEYDYKKENGVGTEALIYERNRKSYAQTYLKAVRYGNTEPFQPLRGDAFDEDVYKNENQWLFRLVFDYGEHADDANGHPVYEATNDVWPLRQDPYSSCRSGFEVRTYRLCRRIMMYHHMPAELDNIENYLVKATVLTHKEDVIVSRLESIQHVGYMQEAVPPVLPDGTGGYVSKSFPAVTFKYSTVKVDHTVHTVTDDQLPNVPQGLDGSQYQFVDLYQEGVNGILAQRNAAWYYKESLGGGSFGPQREVATLPSPALAGSLQLADYEGNGQLDAVVQNGTLNGYYELDEEREWSNYRPFTKPLSFPTNDPNARTLDLNGDGIADYLLTEDDCFLYYPSDGKEGHKAARRLAKQLDEEQGPRVIFKEAFQTIFLADMSGDGLTDIVRIRNGSVCYWPNLGHGRFGAKVTMADAPRFDHPDYYDPARLRTVDINGTGTIDLLYLGRHEIMYWLNASGNAWVEQAPITSFPRTTQLHTVSAFDFLGNGCACLVWSSPLPAQAGEPLKYIQLMTNAKGEAAKPYLLRETDNQMGAITRLEYAPSTEFFLADKAGGKPWVTSIPFVVQVLKRQEVFDAVSKNHFVTRYAYHHGYYDAAEREFRGFGMVEQWDTETYESLKENSLFEVTGRNWSESANQEAVVTRTWFDNGYWKLGKKITDHYQTEYYAGDPDAFKLPDAVLPAVSLSPQEEREAYRALKGSPLRVEVFGCDENDQPKEHPYMVTHSAYEVKLKQRKGAARHASFFVHPVQTLTYHYEGKPKDPRITHEVNLATDQYGSVTEAISLVYPRRVATHHTEQEKVWATYTTSDHRHLDSADTFLRLGLPVIQAVQEVDIIQDVNNKLFDPALFTSFGTSARALISLRVISYYDEKCEALNTAGPAYHGIPLLTRELVVRTEDLENAYGFSYRVPGKVTVQMLEDASYEYQAPYWFRLSGQVNYNLDRFFLPVKQHDPLSGQVYETKYDDYNLAAVSTYFAFKGHPIASTAILDYRTLQPTEITDPNGNTQSVLFDALGMVVVTAVTGKAGEGDTLAGYTMPDLNDAATIKDKALNSPRDLLQGATAFFFYDLFAFQRGAVPRSADARWDHAQDDDLGADAGAEEIGGAVPPSPQRGSSPNFALSLMREVHVSEEGGSPTSPIQVGFAYSDGLGQTI